MGLLWLFAVLFCPSSGRPYKVSADRSVCSSLVLPPNSVAAVFCLFLSLFVSVLAPSRCLQQKKENRLTGDTTQCTCCSFQFFVLCVMTMASVVVLWYLAAFGSNSPRFRGELFVTLFCCGCCSLGTTLIQRVVSLLGNEKSA